MRLKIGDKVRVLTCHYQQWKLLGYGTYLGQEKVYYVNAGAGQPFLQTLLKARFRKGVVYSDIFKIERAK